MRLASSSGLHGLAGLREMSEDGVVLRPLLGAEKGDLMGVCEAAGVPWEEDAANLDPRFSRTLARRLRALDPALDGLLAGAARACQEIRDHIEEEAGQTLRSALRPRPDVMLLPPLPRREEAVAERAAEVAARAVEGRGRLFRREGKRRAAKVLIGKSPGAALGEVVFRRAGPWGWVRVARRW